MFIIRDGSQRLCKDGKMRAHAPIGTQSWCIKEYKTKAAAFRRIQQNRLMNFHQVVEVPDGFELDAAGRIYNDCREVSIEALVVKEPEVKKNHTSVQPLLFGGIRIAPP